MLLDRIQSIVDFIMRRSPEQYVRVLIVDDEPDVRELWRQMLLTLDVRVVCAGTTREAFEYVDNKTADILILDWRIDKQNGSSVLDRWVTAGYGPALVISGYIEDIDINDLYLRGARNVLSKPLQITTLRALVMWYRKNVMIERTLFDLQERVSRLGRMVMILVILIAALQGPQVIEWLVGLVR